MAANSSSRDNSRWWSLLNLLILSWSSRLTSTSSALAATSSSFDSFAHKISRMLREGKEYRIKNPQLTMRRFILMCVGGGLCEALCVCVHSNKLIWTRSLGSRGRTATLEMSGGRDSASQSFLFLIFFEVSIAMRIREYSVFGCQTNRKTNSRPSMTRRENKRKKRYL